MIEEMPQKKKILLFGATGFMGRKFIEYNRTTYDIVAVKREHVDMEKYIDERPVKLLQLIQEYTFDIILFMQGTGPQLSTKQMISSHFEKQMRVNVIGPTCILNKLIEEKKLNDGCSILFLSSIASKKGSYDCAYAASKSALYGLIMSMSNCYEKYKFNLISLGLIENSPIHLCMTDDFVQRHKDAMFGKKLIDISDAITMIVSIIENKHMTKADIALDGGFKITT